MFNLLSQEASERGVSVQELLGKVVLPSWFGTQSTDQNAKAGESGERGGLRKAIQQLKVDAETGTLTAYGERLLLMPLKLMHSIEDLLIKTFGPVAATNFLYEMGKEAGGHSIEFVENAGYKVTSLRGFRRHVTSELPSGAGGG